MKLLKLRCIPVFENDWALTELSLNTNINLIVAQNATGKTRTLNHIVFLSRILSDSNMLSSFLFPDYECIFANRQKNIFKYYIKTIVLEDLNETESELSFSEELYVDDKLVLSRVGSDAKIYSMKSKEFNKISPPDNKLTIHVRRDIIEYPFFEDIISWASNVQSFGFSSIMPRSINIEKHSIGELLNELSIEQSQSVINNLNKIGYQIESIRAQKWNEEYSIVLKEKNIEKEVFQSSLSQGMFRALSVLTFMEYHILNNKSATILIDDLGEGLDYERATKLGKLLVEKLENSNIQFIATSNDSFLMDVIPIKYWNILQRDGNTVRALNYQNSKEQFDKFRLTGLSNFDLFSSDYLLQKL